MQECTVCLVPTALLQEAVFLEPASKLAQWVWSPQEAVSVDSLQCGTLSYKGNTQRVSYTLRALLLLVCLTETSVVWQKCNGSVQAITHF